MDVQKLLIKTEREDGCAHKKKMPSAAENEISLAHVERINRKQKKTNMVALICCFIFK